MCYSCVWEMYTSVFLFWWLKKVAGQQDRLVKWVAGPMQKLSASGRWTGGNFQHWLGAAMWLIKWWFVTYKKQWNHIEHINHIDIVWTRKCYPKSVTSTVYWCTASKLKAARNLYWMSNVFLWVEIFLFFVCYHVFPKRHSQLDYELNNL